MVDDGYRDRLLLAMRNAGVDSHALASHLKVTYQAVQKVIKGSTAEFTASNNAKAAAFLGVDATWLALGTYRQSKDPFSPELMDALRRLPPEQRRRIDNSLRAQLDMDPLPRLEIELSA